MYLNIQNTLFKKINWFKWILIIFTIIIIFLILLIPLISIFFEAFSQGIKIFVYNLKNSDTQHSVLLTIIIALITVPINLLFGILASWLITNFNFFGRRILLNIFNLPFVISPIIVGLIYLLFYGSNSIVGKWLEQYNIKLIFSCTGMVLVTIFITCPFIVLELIPIMIHQGKKEEEAAILFGASGWKIFRYVTLPKIKFALFYGILLTNARSIGEFGAVSIVSGLIRGETYTLPLQIELLYQDYNIVGAFTAATLLTLISVILLFLKSIFKIKIKKTL